MDEQKDNEPNLLAIAGSVPECERLPEEGPEGDYYKEEGEGKTAEPQGSGQGADDRVIHKEVHKRIITRTSFLSDGRIGACVTSASILALNE